MLTDAIFLAARVSVDSFLEAIRELDEATGPPYNLLNILPIDWREPMAKIIAAFFGSEGLYS